jgi:cytochrome c oxidase subunit 2
MTLPSLSRFTKHRALSCVAVAAMPLFFGGWFKWLTGPQSTFDTQGPVAKSQLDVFYVTLWVTGIIFVIVASITAYATLKFKARETDDAKAVMPHQGHGNPLIELSLIALSVLALVFIAVPTLKAIWYNYDIPAEQKENAYEVNATGLQWWFKFEYPKEQIDGAGALVAANELVIPAGRPVRINLRTSDVIHSFWVPKLAGKVDMIPNRGNHLWLQADQPGYFWGQCAEYCGESHAVMRFRVVALNEADFAAWIARQKTAARTVANAPVAGAPAAPYEFKNPGRNAPGYSAQFDAAPFDAWKKQQLADSGEDPALIAQGRQLFQQKNCVTCHSVRGHEGAGTTAPDLTHVGARTTIAAGLLENTKENLHRWIAHPNEVKPGNKMYVGVPTGPGMVMAGYLTIDRATGKPAGHNIMINDAEARALVAYLHSLK